MPHSDRRGWLISSIRSSWKKMGFMSSTGTACMALLPTASVHPGTTWPVSGFMRLCSRLRHARQEDWLGLVRHHPAAGSGSGPSPHTGRRRFRLSHAALPSSSCGQRQLPAGRELDTLSRRHDANLASDRSRACPRYRASRLGFDRQRRHLGRRRIDGAHIPERCRLVHSARCQDAPATDHVEQRKNRNSSTFS